MRTLQEAYEAVETYSPAEERFNRRRRTVGLFLGPAVLVGVLLLPIEGLTPEAHRLAAIMSLVVVFWVSEALPMAATAILGPVLAILFQVAPARNALASFSDPIIFVFIGSFMLAEAMFVHGVDRRLAFTALSWRGVGTSAPRIMITFGGVATVLSMWISNTATTAMLFPIALSIVAHLSRTGGRAIDERRFALGMMLVMAFGASVGGMATPVGTPPNLIGIGLIERIEGIHIDFFQWMALGVPLVVVLFVVIVAVLWAGTTRGVEVSAETPSFVRDELRKLGPLNVGQRNVLAAFGITVVLWTTPGVLSVLGLGQSQLARGYTASVPEAVAAMLGALLLFVLPVNWRRRRFTLTWEEAARIDWGIILLYGGGLALGDLAFQTGLAHAAGAAVAAWLPSHAEIVLIMAFTALAIALSETTSNTASANMIVPVAIAVAKAAGVDPLLPAIGATLGASMGFMMPISTAPNAIVYSSGFVPITSMIKYGVVLDIAGFLVIVTLVSIVGPLVF